MNDHVLDDLEAYALGALDQTDAQRIATHLATCGACRAEAAALAEVVGSLPDSVALRSPPTALRDRVLGAVRADLKPATVGERRDWSPGVPPPFEHYSGAQRVQHHRGIAAAGRTRLVHGRQG
jgi:anti-sigma factor RsiW